MSLFTRAIVSPLGDRNLIFCFTDSTDPNFTEIGKKIKCADVDFFLPLT